MFFGFQLVHIYGSPCHGMVSTIAESAESVQIGDQDRHLLSLIAIPTFRSPPLMFRPTAQIISGTTSSRTRHDAQAQDRETIKQISAPCPWLAMAGRAGESRVAPLCTVVPHPSIALRTMQNDDRLGRALGLELDRRLGSWHWKGAVGGC